MGSFGDSYKVRGLFLVKINDVIDRDSEITRCSEASYPD